MEELARFPRNLFRSQIDLMTAVPTEEGLERLQDHQLNPQLHRVRESSQSVESTDKLIKGRIVVFSNFARNQHFASGRSRFRGSTTGATRHDRKHSVAGEIIK